MKRSVRRRIDNENAAIAKAKNRIFKAGERRRRDARMIAKIRTGSLPYTPVVMSWLSRKLDKPAGKISQQEVESLLA